MSGEQRVDVAFNPFDPRPKSDSYIQHLASLRIDQPMKFRMTNIICTIGPKTNSPEGIAQLRAAGLNIVRMNFSHGSHEFHGSIIANARKSFDVMPGRPIAIALDTKGPEIRTGTPASGEVEYALKNFPRFLWCVTHSIRYVQGAEITLTTDDARKGNGDEKTLYCDYKLLCKSIEVGQKILVADGRWGWFGG